MSALDHISIRGYKSIRELDLDLRPLNVFIGPNGAGKSNLIGVFELLNQIVRGNLQVFIGEAGGADALLYFGRKTTGAIDLALTFFAQEAQEHLRNSYHCRLLPTADDTLIFTAEECWFHDRQRFVDPYVESLGAGHRETRLSKVALQSPAITMADYIIRAMKSWRVYHFHDTSATAQIKFPGDIEDNVDLRDDASNLAAFLYMLHERHAAHYQKIVKSIQLVAPFFDDFDLKPSRLNPEKIRLEWREKGSDAYFNAHALSDGTLRFMCLATLLQMPNPPATILIDEPELGLHPYAITLLAALLRSAATRTQVIVSTQSVTLVNQFAPEDIVVVERQDNQSVFRRPDVQALIEWLEEYGMGDLWEKNLLGGRPR
ncbi:MAG: AAA family ATPase [Anaerolineae bacterium]|nr:AAA family ATPase [Anaerolineae bacterium]